MRKRGRAPGQSPRVLLALVAVVGAVFWFYARAPLHHTDLWGHLAYGRLIWIDQALPATEPFMPLARDARLIDTAWLAQVAGYLAISRFGPPAIQFLHAATIAACFVVLAFACYCKTRSPQFTLAGLALFEALNWYHFRIVRPQMAGFVLFVMLLAAITSRHWRGWHYWAIPAIFALWANAHGSFIVGLGLLVCAAGGRAIDVWRRTKRPEACIRDLRVRRLFLAMALGAAAVLLNPYGLRIYTEALTFSQNPNLADLVEWHPLAAGSTQGRIAILTAASLVVLYRLSPRRVSAGEVLALLVFGGAAVWWRRMLLWWTPIATGCFALHAAAAWQRFVPAVKPATSSPAGIRWTIAAAALAGLLFASSPFGMQLITGRLSDLEQCVSDQTPLGAAAWLREHQPAGQIFNTYEWGDYLVWAGPPNVAVFVTSQAHLVPPRVWRDYMSVIDVAPGWETILNRYTVQTVVIDRRERGALIHALDRNNEWVQVFADGISVIYVRHDGTKLTE